LSIEAGHDGDQSDLSFGGDVSECHVKYDQLRIERMKRRRLRGVKRQLAKIHADLLANDQSSLDQTLFKNNIQNVKRNCNILKGICIWEVHQINY
jgi:hypothetical protein